uniref:Uncharacterized protein n=1 Tax=Oryza barthii TaxID=65489 RepID=A0A0D3GV49_9ORYZ
MSRPMTTRNLAYWAVADLAGSPCQEISPRLFSAQECNYFESTQIPSIRKFLHQYDPLGIRFVFLITIHMMAV